MKSKVTTAAIAAISRELAGGASIREAALAAGISPSTVAVWIKGAFRGDPRLVGLRKAAALGRRVTRLQRERRSVDVANLTSALVRRRAEQDAAVAEERRVADSAAELIEGGASQRRAAELLRVDRETLRSLLKRGRRTGARHLARLVAAAARTARGERCPHCGAPRGRAA